MRRPPLALRALICVALLGFFVYACGGTQWEDGYIYARYTRNALHGLGLVFNAGEHINALTSPLYSYLLLAASWLAHGKIIAASITLYMLFMSGTCILAEVFFPWSGLFFATFAYTYSLLGMETPVVLFFLLLSIWLFQKERYDLLPLSLTLLALTRFECAAMVPVVAYGCYRRNQWPSWRGYVVPLLIVGTYLTINHASYGSFIPASSSAKIGQGRSGFWGKWPRAFLYGYRLGRNMRPPFYSVFVMIAALPFAIRRLRNSAWNQTALPFALILFAFYVLLNLPAYHWYYAPFILLLVMYTAAELTALRFGVVALALLIVVQSVESYSLLQQAKVVEPTPYGEAAAWLMQNTPANATVECLEVGIFGWYLDRHLDDSLGLTLPKNADHVAHRDFSSWLEEDKPDYVLYHTTRDFPFEKVIVKDPNYQPTGYDRMGIMIYRRTTPKSHASTGS